MSTQGRVALLLTLASVASVATAACAKERPPSLVSSSASVEASGSAPIVVARAPEASVVDAGPSSGEPSDAGVCAPDAGARPKPPCPEGMALVQRFCIDKYEAALVGNADDGGFASLPHNHEPPSDTFYKAVSMPDVMPQAYINRPEAALACKNAGKRLCSMKEWRRACGGPSAAQWPYGKKKVAGRCNHEKAHLLSIKFGSDPRHWTYANFNDPTLDLEPGFLAKTGAFDGCATAEGVFDLVGNVHEWVSDTVDAALIEAFEAEEVERKGQPWRTGNGIFMGGFFSTADQHGPGCTFTTIAHEPAYHDYSVGFRCCAAADLPPPSKPDKKTKKK